MRANDDRLGFDKSNPMSKGKVYMSQALIRLLFDHIDSNGAFANALMQMPVAIDDTVNLIEVRDDVIYYNNAAVLKETHLRREDISFLAEEIKKAVDSSTSSVIS